MGIEYTDLCVEIKKAMESLEFSERSIQQVITDQRYTSVMGQEETIQRASLVLLFYAILTSRDNIPPGKIRIALNIAHTCDAWLVDMQLVILPWLKANEELFFA